MRGLRPALLIVVGIAVFSFRPAASQTQISTAESSSAFSGRVSSAEEGAMEGALISAKKEGSTISFTVVSDTQGNYRFPTGRLEPGRYALKIRAGGYDLDSPSYVDLAAGKNATIDIKLRKTSNPAAQLSNAEWLTSFPGTPEQKASVQGCTHCHTLERIVRSHHDADEFMSVLERMSHHTPESFPLLVQPDGPGRTGGGEMNTDQLAQQQANRKKQADYLASLNLSAVEQWSYPLQVAARPSGKAT